MEFAYEVESNAIDEAKRHLQYHHFGATGWITIAKKELDGTWKQYHYRLDQLLLELPNWQGTNVYFSQNSFFKPQRRIENIRQLRALYVDIDCHQMNYKPDWVVGKLSVEVFDESLPSPNYILFSGRGIVCIWLIEPVPYMALPLWQAIQQYFVDKLVYVGADKKSIDASRVFRVAGSINSKNGQKVKIEYRHDYRYRLRDLQDEYLPELKAKKAYKSGSHCHVVHLFTIRTLHYDRLRDLVELVKMREFDLKGHREVICFLYRYWSCCFSANLQDSLNQMLEFNNDFLDPLPEHEVIRATKSAEKAWQNKNDVIANEEAKLKGYPGAGYNLRNTTIINWLEITQDEQKNLKTIIDDEEKKCRKRNRDKLAFRKQHGCISREQYIYQQNEKTKDRLCQLQEAMGQYPIASNVDLSHVLNCSEGYIRKLKKLTY